VTPETCRVTLQEINICILLHLLGFLLTLNYDARNHELKIYVTTLQKAYISGASNAIVSLKMV
jgi:hypothetical protein